MTKLFGSYTIRFLVVGAAAFAFNYALMWLLHSNLRLDYFMSELVSMAISVNATFLAHDRWTYFEHKANSALKLGRRYSSYLASNLMSAGLTVILFGAFVTFAPSPVALLAAAGVSTIWNYLANRFIIWRKEQPVSDV